MIFLFVRSEIGTRNELKKMDFWDAARPFVRIPARTTGNLLLLDFWDAARPFVAYARG